MATTIRNSSGEEIDYELLESDGRFSDWIVLLGHGVTGNRDRPVIADTAEALNQAGFTALAFSFSGNGKSEGAFNDSCVSKGVTDLEAVLN
ncbi:MAG: alpha/beta hydrolase, partial [Opitutales bacterium]|nr:alpha/beta hydrolase [Opitutales bacterium]